MYGDGMVGTHLFIMIVSLLLGFIAGMYVGSK